MTTVNETLVEFPIESKDANGSFLPVKDLAVEVEGPQNVQGTLKDKLPTGIFVSFVTNKTGDYKVTVLRNGGIWQRVTVHVKVKEGQGETPQIPSLPPSEPQKHPVRFQVDAKDKSGQIIKGSSSDFAISVSGPETITGAKGELSDGKLLISFETYVLSGDFTVDVSYKGASIQRSPFTVTLTKKEGDESKNDEIPSLPPEDESKTIQFTVGASLADGSEVKAKDLVVTVDQGPDTTWDPTVADHEDGQLLVSFKTNTLGNYTVSIKKGATHILGSPFHLQM